MHVLQPLNRILSHLTKPQINILQPHLQLVSLDAGTVLSEPGSLVEAIYFPENCLITKGAVTEEGEGVEIGMVGQEGMTGICQFLGGESTPFRNSVQIGGNAYCIPAPIFLEIVQNDARLHREVSQYTLNLLRMISQSAACNLLHNLSQRVARWLLLASDGVASSDLPLTHETLALLLGVRRQSVTAAAREFAQRELISYRWGQISILDRSGLENAACDCYRLIRGFASCRVSEGQDLRGQPG